MRDRITEQTLMKNGNFFPDDSTYEYLEVTNTPVSEL